LALVVLLVMELNQVKMGITHNLEIKLLPLAVAVEVVTQTAVLLFLMLKLVVQAVADHQVKGMEHRELARREQQVKVMLEVIVTKTLI
jgi:hypothetical protein